MTEEADERLYAAAEREIDGYRATIERLTEKLNEALKTCFDGGVIAGQYAKRAEQAEAERDRALADLDWWATRAKEAWVQRDRLREAVTKRLYNCHSEACTFHLISCGQCDCGYVELKAALDAGKG